MKYIGIVLLFLHSCLLYSSQDSNASDSPSEEQVLPYTFFFDSRYPKYTLVAPTFVNLSSYQGRISRQSFIDRIIVPNDFPKDTTYCLAIAGKFIQFESYDLLLDGIHKIKNTEYLVRYSQDRQKIIQEPECIVYSLPKDID